MSVNLEKYDEQLNEMIDYRITNIGKTIRQIIPDYNQAILKNPPFNSPHEGWAVLKQGVDQLWEEVKKNKNSRSIESMRKEATFIGATVMRFLIELCNEENQNK